MGEIFAHHPSKLPEDLKKYARQLRQSMPDAEALCWYFLRDRRLANAKFRRQHPVGRYIIDFYCDEFRLAVELDGGQHAEQKEYDQKRDADLNKMGIKVLRFWNHQMLNQTEDVLTAIYNEIINRKS